MASSTGNLLVENDADVAGYCPRSVAAQPFTRKMNPGFVPEWMNGRRATLPAICGGAMPRLQGLPPRDCCGWRVLPENAFTYCMSRPPMNCRSSPPTGIWLRAKLPHIISPSRRRKAYRRLGTKAQMNPPVRDGFHRERLWQAVRSGLFDVLGSDHAPHTLAEKERPTRNRHRECLVFKPWFQSCSTM